MKERKRERQRIEESGENRIEKMTTNAHTLGYTHCCGGGGGGSKV